MNKEYVGLIDLFLVPVYFLVLYLIVRRIRRKNPDNFLIQKYLIKGFVFKLACAVFYGLLIFFYYGYGDSLTYFKDALNIKQAISSGNETFDVLFRTFKQVKLVHDTNLAGSEGGWLVQRLSLILSYFAFNRFFVVTILFASLAYAGMFRMFQTFCDLMPGWHKRIALIVLFLPSMAVYGSGILKDTICISAMGWLIYAVHQLVAKKKFNLKFFFITALSMFVLAVVKIYILAAFVLPFVLYVVMLALNRIKNVFFRKILFPVFIAALAITYISFAEKIDTALGTYAVEKLFETVKEQQQAFQDLDQSESGSSFDIGTVEPTIGGFIKKMPAGITATLFRPFLWETRKVVMFFSALESFLFFLFTAYVIFKAGLFRFIKLIFKDPFIFLCISYSLIFAALVGLSTPNFGTLARYRIPVLPFYLAGLMAIWYRSAIMRRTQHENIALSPPHQTALHA